MGMHTLCPHNNEDWTEALEAFLHRQNEGEDIVRQSSE
jgi:hypothetical protein